MALKAPFLTLSNFQLAFQRLVRSQNRDYKQQYAHLLGSYNLGLKQNLEDLINNLKTNSYQPSPPLPIFAPKPTGILRPMKLLVLRDLIVYQAMVNTVANRFFSEQQNFTFKRCFGAIYAGKNSPFFYRSWKVCYGEYGKYVEKAFRIGNKYVADFDLVSFYDLVDHSRLRTCLEAKLRDEDLLDLLFRCLRVWSVHANADAPIGHGVPQGPDASAFLAECLLFSFDRMKFRDVVYARYIDDIRLMARDEVPVRRALLRLDLKSRALGLVPQAQKIGLRKVKAVSELRKSLPSGLVSPVGRQRTNFAKTQERLLKSLRQSLGRANGQTVIQDVTAFKFSLLRLRRRKAVLRRIRPLLISRPDCSWVLSRYLMKFSGDKEAADVLLTALKRDPTYDASASHYIDAMDVCEPTTNFGPYRRVIRTVNRRSEERSILLSIASHAFLGRRYGPAKAIQRIMAQGQPIVRTVLLQRLFADQLERLDPAAFQRLRDCLVKEACGNDEDAARFCAALLLLKWPWSDTVRLPMRAVHRSVKILMFALGLRRRGPRKATVLEVFFREKQQIVISFPWKKALGADWREAERRCLKLQKLALGNPGTRLLLLDTFNELLVQNFSVAHPTLRDPYQKECKKKPQPDWGAWLYNQSLKTTLPYAAVWFSKVHDARKTDELAHAKLHKGGKYTKPTSFSEMERLTLPAAKAWSELIRTWKPLV